MSESSWLDEVGKSDFAWPTIALAVVAVGGFVGLGIASAIGIVPFAIAIPVQGFLAFASFTPMHDASHKAIAPKSRWIDEVVGWICGLPVLAAFSGLKYLHLEHHKHTNDPVHDPDSWSSQAKSRVGIVLRWLVLDLHYLARYVTKARTRPRAEVVTCALGVVVMLGSWVVFVATGHGLELLLCWLVPSRIAIVMLSVFFDWIPHSPRRTTVAEDPYRASNVYEHRWLTPVLLAQNYHLVHHLFPGVPFYRYGAVYWKIKDELVARGADLRRIGSRLAVAREHAVLRVAQVIEEAADARTFVFEVPVDLDYRYRAGQFVVVHTPAGKRCYSISRANGDLAITVKRHGVVSSWLHEHAAPGTRLRVDRPAGRFVLDDGATNPLVLFAAGSGITPVIAIVDDALRNTPRAVTLVYANRDAASTIFRARLQAIESPRFTLVLHDDAAHGLVDAQRLAEHIAAGADVYACGPAGFLDVVDRASDLAGAARRFTERFVQRLGSDAEHVVPAVSFVGIRRGERHQICVRPGETLLAAGRRAGLALRASCDEGYCGTCASRVACGRVDHGAWGALSDGDLARGFVLPCRARALAPEPVVVDFDATP